MNGNYINFCLLFLQKENQQKLIYSGQLLHDHLMLKDVLRQVSFHKFTQIIFNIIFTKSILE